MIDIIVTGFRIGDLSLDSERLLKGGGDIILHTERCALGEWLREQGIAFSSYDELYEKSVDFDEHIKLVLDDLMKHEDAIYCVMDTGDESAKALVKKRRDVRVHGGGAYAALELRSEGAFTALSASELGGAPLSPRSAALIREIDNRLLAGEVKLKLEEAYGEEGRVFFMDSEGRVIDIKLSDLDRMKRYDHSCACLANPCEASKIYDFEGLKLISEHYIVKDDGLDVKVLAKSLADVVQSIHSAEKLDLFTQSELFERAAAILSQGG